MITKMNNQYFGVNTNGDEKMVAAYNTRLRRYLMTEEIQGDKVVLALPDHMSDTKKNNIKKIFERDGYSVIRCISESEAAVAYHATQQKSLLGDGLVRVINLGESGTNITLLKCRNGHAIPFRFKRVGLGGMHITGHLGDLIFKKISGGNSLYKRIYIYNKAEKLKILMGSNRKRSELLEFGSETVKITRREYDSCCATWFLRLLMELDSFDRGEQVMATIIIGGGGNCEYVAEALKKKYGNAYVTNYKASEAAALGAAVYAKRLGGIL